MQLAQKRTESLSEKRTKVVPLVPREYSFYLFPREVELLLSAATQGLRSCYVDIARDKSSAREQRVFLRIFITFY